MSSIYKYILPVNGRILMKEGAEILRIGVQFGQPYIWALVDTLRLEVIREFDVVPTGGSPDPGIGAEDYIDTFFLENEELVFHVFDKGEQK